MPTQRTIARLSGGVVPYSAAVLALGPVGYWPLGEGGGVTAADLAGTNAGTYTGSTQPTLGVKGMGLSDDSTAVTFTAAQNQYVALRTGTPIIGGQANFSVIAWVKDLSAVARRPVYSERPATGNDLLKFELNVTDGKISYTHRDDAATLLQTSSATGVISGGPHLAIWVKAGATITFYVDAVASAGSNDTASDNFTDANIQSRIMSDASGQYTGGTVAHVAVWRRALTLAEVTKLYAARLG
jgi:hypothetical protein